MTSFLALRASVCAYLWCLIPPVCYIGFEQRPPSHSQRSLAGYLSASGRSPVRNLLRPLYLFLFFSPERARFCLGASSIRSSVLRQPPGACFVFVMGIWKRKKTEKPNEGWEEDRIPTCTSRIVRKPSISFCIILIFTELLCFFCWCQDSALQLGIVSLYCRSYPRAIP